MEATRIYSMETLIIALRRFVRLNRQPNLSKKELVFKNDYEAQIIDFLNNLENNTRQDSEDNKPNYSLEQVTEFIKQGCVPYLSSEQEEEVDKSAEFRNKLTELMKKKKVKSKEVIEKTGINQSVFSKVKVGLRSPSKDVLDALSKYFKHDFTIYQ